MGWKQERDSLIAQTLVFVQSVTGRREEIVRPRAAAVDLDELAASLERFAPPPIESARAAVPAQPVIEAAAIEAAAIDAAAPAMPANSVEPPPRALPRRPIIQSEMQEEIRARIASFRAHQERFNREREEYFSATLARLKAAIKDQSSSRLGK